MKSSLLLLLYYYSVSYTHLDVYKRQVLAYGSEFWTLSENFNCGTWQVIDAVPESQYDEIIGKKNGHQTTTENWDIL